MRNWKVLALVLIFVFAGCNNDKPPVPLKKKSAEGEPAPEAKKDGPAKGEPAGETGKPAAGEPGDEVPAAVDAKQTTEQLAAAEVAKADAARTKAMQVQLDRTLRKVTAFGVTGPIATTRDKVIGMLPVAIQAKGREGFDAALKQMAGEGKLANMDWLDLTRGIGFAFEGKDKPLIAVPITTVDAFKAALPADIVGDEQGGYLIGDAYVLPYNNVLFLTDTARTLEIIEGDLKLELTRLTTDKTVLLVLGGESLKTLVSGALDEFERNLGENMPMQQEQKEFLAKLFNFLKELLGEIDQIKVTMDLANKDLVVRYEITTVDGSRLSQSVASIKPGNFKAAGFLPAKSYLVLGQNVAAASAAPYMNRYVDLVATAWKLKEEERGEFTKMYTRMVNLFGPDAAFGMYADSSFPMAMSSVTKAADGLAARDQIYAFYMLVLNKVIEELPPDQRQIFASGSLKQVVDSFAPVLMNLGVNVKMESEDYRSGKVDYLVFTFDWEKLNLPPSAAWVKQVVRSRLGGALGFSKDYMVFTFGPNPIVRAKEILDETPGLKMVELIGPGVEENKYFMVGGLSVDRLMGAILDVGVVATMIGQEPWVEKARQINNLVLTAGTDGGALWAQGVVGIGSVVKAFEAELVEEVLREKKTPEVAPVVESPAAEPAGEEAPAAAQ
jgi:hypothetical protein